MKHRYIGDILRIEDFPYYDVELIENEKLNKYMEYYLKNLQILYSKGINLSFLNIDEFITEESADLYKSATLDIKDKWLFRKNIEEFGKTLEKEGTYWIVSARIENEQLIIEEGRHRLYALKAINSNKRLLCIIEDDANYLDKPIELYSLMLDKTSNHWFKGDLYLSSLEKVEPNIYKVGTNYLPYIYHIIYFFGAFLGRLIYRYRDEIKPSPIVNDEKEFYKFVNS